MSQLALIPSQTCRHHASIPFQPGSKNDVEDSAEQSQYFLDIVLWLFHHQNVQDPIAELKNPKSGRLLEEIRSFHRGCKRFLRISAKNLRLGVLEDCSCCQWLSGPLSEKDEVGQLYEDYFVLHCSNECKAWFELPSLSQSWWERPDSSYTRTDQRYLSLICFTDEFWSWAPSEQRHLLTSSAPLESVLSRVREWMVACASENTNCIKRTATFIPTRILEISAHEGVPSVRLMKPTKPLRSYAALSYCWGVHVQHGWLTGAVMHDYEQGINFARLPQTIQDAVIVTKGLHVQYLWVDSLCIIQDDETDKDREIDQMGKIYENSTITILASQASNVTAGFLNPDINYGHEDTPCVLEMSGDFSTTRSDGDKTTSRSIVLSGENSSYVPDKGPLRLRGWAFQERLLSYRTINFTSSEITWGCSNHRGPARFRERYKYTRLYGGVPEFHDYPKLSHQCWAEVVTTFAELSLSYPQDRLPALAGIAQRWGESVDDSYAAGLWRSSLPEALLWHAPRSPYTGLDSNDTLFAPSWSWAAIAGPFELRSDIRDTVDVYAECRDVKITCKLPGSVFGAVANGTVTLYGVMISVTISMVRCGVFREIMAVFDDQGVEIPSRVYLDRDISIEDTAFYVLPIRGRYRSGQITANQIEALLVVQNSDGSFSRRGFLQMQRKWELFMVGSKQLIELV